jgi:flavorubredoxin
MDSTIPTTTPVALAEDTWLIPNLAPAGPDAFVPANSMLIRGTEPVIVDTGTLAHRARWLEQVFGLVDPADVRWVFLSHDDGDHIGNLHEVLDLCPNATLVANFFTNARVSLEDPVPLPLDRMIWREPGAVLDVGDRRLRLFLPPIFDGPTTRGLLDERTGVLWAVDSFAAATPGAVHAVEDLPPAMYDETFALFNSLVSPWHQWLDRDVYRQHTDTVQALAPRAVASAHGPVLTGDAIADAFDRVRAMAGAPIVEPPGQPALDEILASFVAVAEPVG